ncbi:TerD family protein [Acetivibrio saccincola]|jgi:stress response protein SCP2|uniref:Stress protein n=1 Tax=Acetivibrio saccincola TaxID=1677857 RepID=A0A2K9EPU4_9FIRM|nr:TerD family protein [Acetivibrio saccincola]AUG57520.1 Stress response protein SCP2 [Acetivibrio saccincola]NLW26018.1 TerD family protein [Acetivibrio saccincola]PQQ67435.1 stress protein [Acetivibrio saccincola]HOA96533.1 TerD family protein [Acetivibrio saccincola]HQD29341.1 TerD family protein [Acetivibrio saccincola]
MAVNLQKGQRVDLTKGNAGLTKLMVGLGWDEAEKTGKGGFFASLFSSPPPPIDCDASVLMLNENGKLTRKEDLIYFGNLRSMCGSVVHTGDNLTGEGEGDDEVIIVEINKIPPHIHRLVFLVNIYDCVRRNQHFGMIKNAFIRVVNASNNQELIRFNLSDNYHGKTTLFAGEIYRYNNEWKFAAIGEATNDTSLREIVKRY